MHCIICITTKTEKSKGAEYVNQTLENKWARKYLWVNREYRMSWQSETSVTFNVHHQMITSSVILCPAVQWWITAMGQIVFSTQFVVIPGLHKLFHFLAQEWHEHIMQSKEIDFTVCTEVLLGLQFPWTINTQHPSTTHIQCKLKCNACGHLFNVSLFRSFQAVTTSVDLTVTKFYIGVCKSTHSVKPQCCCFFPGKCNVM